jgi:hypothetical protein
MNAHDVGEAPEPQPERAYDISAERLGIVASNLGLTVAQEQASGGGTKYTTDEITLQTMIANNKEVYQKLTEQYDKNNDQKYTEKAGYATLYRTKSDKSYVIIAYDDMSSCLTITCDKKSRAVILAQYFGMDFGIPAEDDPEEDAEEVSAEKTRSELLKKFEKGYDKTYQDKKTGEFLSEEDFLEKFEEYLKEEESGKKEEKKEDKAGGE